MNFVRDIIVGKIRSMTHYHCQMVMKKNSLSIPTFEWLNRCKNTYTYIYIKRIIVMEMKSPWMPTFDRQNRGNKHMHIYIY